MLSYAEIKKEFDESLGYIRNDINAIRRGMHTVNYTVALLIGCGCEMLAAARGDKKRRGERVFTELLPTRDWQLLADRLYTALRDGLAHGFDTKHLDVDQQTIQICISWTNGNAAEIQRVRQELGLFIGVQPLAEALSAKIDEFEKLLRHDEEVEWTPLSRPFFARNKLMPTGSRV
ncbi:MAG: hypothetical protein ABSH44_24575 [Bryobacteraceae bacterium]|jgi:hypothetical protein